MTSLSSHRLSFAGRCRDACWISLGLVAGVASAWAEPTRVYRCGNVYTNQPDAAGHCQPMTGSAVTVIEGTRVQGTSSVSAVRNANPAGPKISSAEQLQRDVQVQAVLHTELQKAQQQHAALLREWNNGEPERRADEHRQPQKYQAREAQLRHALQRTEADIAGLQRELSRLPVTPLTGP